MAMNRIQFQAGLSLPAFLEQYGTEVQCEAALERTRWQQGFHCSACNETAHYVLKGRTHKTFQCKGCRLQTSLIAGTLFQSTHLALTIWFLAIYLVSQAKTGLSSLALKRQLGVSYPTAWLIQQKLMQTMSERDTRYRVTFKWMMLISVVSLLEASRGVALRTKFLLLRRFRLTPKGIRCTSKWLLFQVLRVKPLSNGLSKT
jgi:transposase-like protein